MESAQFDPPSATLRLTVARGLLTRTQEPEAAWPALAAAAAFAVCAMAFAVSAILAPPSTLSPMPSLMDKDAGLPKDFG